MQRATDLERTLRSDLTKIKGAHEGLTAEHKKLAEKYETDVARGNEVRLQDDEANTERVSELENYAQ